MSTTLHYMVPGNQETAPEISHDNFHRVHGAQVAVLCGTCGKPVLTGRKLVETRSAIRKDHVSHVFENV